MLTVIDQYDRRSPLIEPYFCFSGAGVATALDRVIVNAGTPVSNTVDHGTEFTSNVLEERAEQRGIKLDFIRPGTRAKRAIAPFDGRLRDECLATDG